MKGSHIVSTVIGLLLIGTAVIVLTNVVKKN